MLNKPADKKFCGVRQNKIETAQPVLNLKVLEHYLHFMSERYKIRLRKDVERLPPPWTADPILRDYRFTNLRREHDRESLWLIHNVCENQSLSYENKLANCILFRLFNKKETMIALGAPLDFKNIDLKGLQSKIDDHVKAQPGYTWFTAAFFVSGMRNAIRKEQLKIPGASLDPRLMIVEKTMRIMDGSEYACHLMEAISASKDQKDVYDILIAQPGIAGFLGYQIFVDFTYIPEFPFSENEFTIAGPGCKMGLDFLFEDRDGMTHDECIFWVRDNIERIAYENGIDFSFYELFSDLPEHDRRGNVMSLENSFCELSKYYRAISETGRPKKKYREAGVALPGDTGYLSTTVSLI